MDVTVISRTIQAFNGERYYLCGKYFERKTNGLTRRLHRIVWSYHNGEIPKYYHIHHIDENTSNNDISNLELILGSLHLSQHGKSPSRADYNKRHIQEIRVLASEWHRSPEGRKWHSIQAKKQIRVPREYTCTCCGKPFTTTCHYGDDQHTFCSNNCKSMFRRKNGFDNEERKCVYCGRMFVANKYSRSKCCSRDCAVKKRWNR